MSKIIDFMKNIYVIQTIISVGVIIIGILLYGGIIALSDKTPTQLKISDEEKYLDSFIGERSENHLKQLTSIGPKVVGSYENEVLAVNFLKKEIMSIIQQKNEKQDIVLDHQIVSNSQNYDYENLQNIVVRLASENNLNSSLLINCHFDSVPTSPGGSDDGINCANMLEVLRVFSKSSTRPLNNIIFLFNGGEETGLQASYGFITKHKWSRECRAFINLEGAGAGGKEILFQAGPGNSFLIDTYSKNVPYPFGHSLGEEIFQNNLIPSDTDFRIFRTYGEIPGMDFAFFKNGYVYHTKYDNMDGIKPGVYQSSGENLLALIKSLANSDKLSKASLQDTEKTVYFDFLGLFFISYNLTMSLITNLCVLLLSFIVAFKTFFDFKTDSKLQFFYIILLNTVALIAGWTLSILFSLLTATLLDQFELTMSWYTHQQMIFGLYFCPTIIFCSVTIMLFNYYYNKDDNFDVSTTSQIQAHIVRLIIGLFLLTTSFIFQRSSYIFLIPIIFNILSFVIIICFKLTHKRLIWVSIYLIGLIIPTVFWMYLTSIILQMFIPITGRSGSSMNPELMIGLLSTILCIFIIQFFIPLVTLLRKPVIMIVGLASIYIITFGMVAFSSYGFPYSGDPQSPTPQRYEIYHSLREFYDEDNKLIKNDSGYFFSNMDRNFPSLIKNYVNETNFMVSLKDCDKTLFCGLPSYEHEKKWIPASPPLLQQPIELQLKEKENNTYTFEISGPNCLMVFLMPKPNTNLIIINHSYNTLKWNDRSVYVINYNNALKLVQKHIFKFFMKLPPEYNSNYTVDISVIGISTDYEKLRTPDFIRFLNKFPEWAHIVAYYSQYQSWIF